MYVCIYNMRKYTTFFKTKRIASNTNYFLGRTMPTIDLRGNGWHISEMQIFHPPKAVSVPWPKKRLIYYTTKKEDAHKHPSPNVTANCIKDMKHQQKIYYITKKGRCSWMSLTYCHCKLCNYVKNIQTPMKVITQQRGREAKQNTRRTAAHMLLHIQNVWR